eukprot:CAMPEP_0194071312 /NCGR_PEP_ID=MMETSP0009_2-20130614/88640_1 /TAXON_ID=210454 /ORGANISM="Grammatophora oceanica, Strain CCMP 410" /LENGTH=472 /DNA_ID=CAMNT_0038724627 /DNA_START=391 /DNA_END=1806 /DNA_ORIENTATION=+
MTILVNRSFDNGKAMMNEDTPQNKAANWLIWEHDAAFLATYSDDILVQRYAMATIYFSLGGAAWLNNTNWLDSSVSECKWHLQSSHPCDHSTMEMTDVAMPQNFLRGSQIPAEIALLTKVKILDFSSNSIGGSIPTEIGFMTNLESVILSSNHLRGALPKELSRVTNLRILAVGNNRLASPESVVPSSTHNHAMNRHSGQPMFPAEFGPSLSNLVVLALSNNPTMGGAGCTIPSSLGQLTSLQKLDLHGTNPSGGLPSEIGLLTNLIHMEVPGSLQSPAPSELSNLRQLLSLSFAMDTTEIPSELGQMTSLVELKLKTTGGTLPPELGTLSNLEVLSAGECGLRGTIPPSFGGLSSLTSLDLSMTQVHTTIPTQLGQLTRLLHVDLHTKHDHMHLAEYQSILRGTIPSELGRWTRLTYLDVANTLLEGTIPSTLNALANLEVLQLAHTNLRGSIEQMVCDANRPPLLYSSAN